MKGFFSSSKVQKEKPVGLVAKCGACGLYKTCKSPKMGAYGDGAKGILVVGEAPGKTEDEEGRPFVGKAGSFLRGVLAEIDVDLDRDAWTTNALICRPPKNATPDLNQISYCRPNLLNVIRFYDPTVIVTLGRSALISVLSSYWKDDVGPMDRWVGWRIPLENTWICPTYHPAFLLRMKNPLMDRLFTKDLTMAFGLSVRPPKPKEPKIEILYDEKEICREVQGADDAGGWVAVDYETNCLKPEWPEARIVSCSISNGYRTISYPWIGEAVKATGRFLKSKRTKKISSNLKMEERWTLKTFGHGVTNWGWDTMLATHCLDNRPGICSLKFQSFVRLGVPTYNENIEPYLSSVRGSPYNRIREIDMKDLLLYGGMDSFLEYRLAMKQRKDMGYE